jgi:carboxylesterase
MMGTRPDIGVLLVHGFMGDTREIRPLADVFNGLGLYCYAPLLPGHGGSPALLDGVTDQALIEAVRQGIEQIRMRCARIVVCGFSMGGALTAIVSGHYPVEAFITLAPMIQIANPLIALSGIAPYFLPYLYPLKFLPLDAFGLREEILDIDPTLNLDDPAVLQRLKTEIRFPVAITYELNKLAQAARAAAGKIAVPTLIVQGEADRVVSPQGARWLHSHISVRDKTLVMLPHSPHRLTLPENLLRDTMLIAIRDWLAKRL